MKLSTFSKPNAKSPVDTLALFVLEGEKKPLGAWQRLAAGMECFVQHAIAKEGFIGKEKQVSVVYPDGEFRVAKRILVTGLGKREKCDLERIRRAAAIATNKAKSVKSKQLAFIPPFNLTSDSKAYVAQALVEGTLLVSYEFKKYKSQNSEENSKIESLDLFTVDAREEREVQGGIAKGGVYSRATCFTRDLVNEPASVMTPRRMAEIAKQVAKNGTLSVKIYDEKQIEKMGMGGLLGVSLGSEEPPRFVHLMYKAPKARKTVAIVGKGITFDSGGLCIKTADSMLNMKDDMSGAAAVLGVFSVLRELRPKVNVHGIFAATENMPGGRAYKTRDVLKALNGKTMEIVNTDAEGRLILSDALSYASRLKPDQIIDMATLTGAIVVALGNDISGIFSNRQELAQKIIEMGKKAGEKIWSMPLEEEYFEMIKSDVADIKNSGGRYGGSVTAALFLKEFVDEKIPWAHIDIAGTALLESSQHYKPAGGTGVMVRTLLHYLESF